MSGLSTDQSLATRAFRLIFGDWPRFQMRRRGGFLVIVNRWGRIVSYSRGVIGGQWAWRELNRPLLKAEPALEGWQIRIQRANQLCDKWQSKLNDMRSATSAVK